MELQVHPDPAAVAVTAAAVVVEAVAASPRPVLGLATGATMTPVYDAVAHRHRHEGTSLAAARAFLLDEYVGLPEDDPRRFRCVVQRQLVDRVDLDPARVVAPRVDDPDAAGEEYEQRLRAAGGVDVQLVGLGRNGHIGFNEPGSSFTSRTRRVTLTASTREANGLGPDDPHEAVTMGIGTVLAARQVVLVATGAHKAGPVARAVDGPIGTDCPASALRHHPRCLVLVDEAAASGLRRR